MHLFQAGTIGVLAKLSRRVTLIYPLRNNKQLDRGLYPVDISKFWNRGYATLKNFGDFHLDHWRFGERKSKVKKWEIFMNRELNDWKRKIWTCEEKFSGKNQSGQVQIRICLWVRTWCSVTKHPNVYLVYYICCRDWKCGSEWVEK